MQKEYTSPEMVEYGTIEELTLGREGPACDYLCYTFSG